MDGKGRAKKKASTQPGAETSSSSLTMSQNGSKIQHKKNYLKQDQKTTLSSEACIAVSSSQNSGAKKINKRDILKDTSDSEIKELSRNISFYLLTNCSKIPVSRSELKSNFFKLNKSQETYGRAINQASDDLDDIFGLCLYALDGKPLEMSDKLAICNNNVPLLDTSLQHYGMKNSQAVLLLLVLSCIYMSGGELLDEELMDFLNQLQINHLDINNPAFGNVQTMLKLFVTQHYLQRKVSDNGSDSIQTSIISWGPRAVVEVSKKRMMNFLIKIYGGVFPEYYCHLFRKANLIFENESEGSIMVSEEETEVNNDENGSEEDMDSEENDSEEMDSEENGSEEKVDSEEGQEPEVEESE